MCSAISTSWWLASNSEHDRLEHLDSLPPTQVGARLRVREKIGGIPGVAEGTITAVHPGAAVTWEADARYRWFGIPLRVGEGVTWRVEPSEEATTRVSARVWATFPRHLVGRIAAFAFMHLLNGVEKDREHTRTELATSKRSSKTRARSLQVGTASWFSEAGQAQRNLHRDRHCSSPSAASISCAMLLSSARSSTSFACTAAAGLEPTTGLQAGTVAVVRQLDETRTCSTEKSKSRQRRINVTRRTSSSS